MASRPAPTSFVLALIALACATSVALAAAGQAQRGKPPAPSDLPPVSMTCPMHPDVVESSPGTCPICKMNLVAVRLESIWTCPVHAVVHKSEAGTCPICRRPLIQMTVALTFTCSDHPEIDQIERGTCPDGKPMVDKRTLRPHGNHNPQHGGQFFMAPDNTHHLEGAYPRARLFRLYLYDDYARPLPNSQIKQVKARVVTQETFDTRTSTATEIAAFPLAAARGSNYLEARIAESSLPAQMTAKVRFKDDGPEYRFDFTFPALTKEPVPAAAVTAATSTKATGRTGASTTAPRSSSGSDSTAAPTPAAAPASATVTSNVPAAANPTSAAGAGPAIDPAQISQPIPETTQGILAQLNAGSDQIRDLIQKGDFGAVWVPAFQARDLAIALEGRLDQLPAGRRELAEPAIKRVVRTAWLLDAFGDLGNRQQIADAYTIFAASVAETASAFTTKP